MHPSMLILVLNKGKYVVLLLFANLLFVLLDSLSLCTIGYLPYYILLISV